MLWYFLLTHHAMQNAEASDTAIVIPRFTLLYCKDRGTLARIQYLFRY